MIEKIDLASVDPYHSVQDPGPFYTYGQPSTGEPGAIDRAGFGASFNDPHIDFASIARGVGLSVSYTT